MGNLMDSPIVTFFEVIFLGITTLLYFLDKAVDNVIIGFLQVGVSITPSPLAMLMLVGFIASMTYLLTNAWSGNLVFVKILGVIGLMFSVPLLLAWIIITVENLVYLVKLGGL